MHVGGTGSRAIHKKTLLNPYITKARAFKIYMGRMHSVILQSSGALMFLIYRVHRCFLIVDTFK